MRPTSFSNPKRLDLYLHKEQFGEELSSFFNISSILSTKVSITRGWEDRYFASKKETFGFTPATASFCLFILLTKTPVKRKYGNKIIFLYPSLTT